MLSAFLISVAVVFVAELGDKSQLIAMTYALRHRWWVVLTGVGLGAFAVHGLSVTIGYFLGAALPERPIAFVAALAFLGFAAWTWRERGEDLDAAPTAERRIVIPAIVSSFVLAELGDKTMLATVALASDNHWAGVWLGATAGMILADGAAIAVGAVLGRRLPARFLRGLASVLFLLFGLFLLFDGALDRPGLAVVVVSAVGVGAAVGAGVTAARRRNRRTDGVQPSGHP